jgi:hypothetical protein
MLNVCNAQNQITRYQINIKESLSRPGWMRHAEASNATRLQIALREPLAARFLRFQRFFGPEQSDVEHLEALIVFG